MVASSALTGPDVSANPVQFGWTLLDTSVTAVSLPFRAFSFVFSTAASALRTTSEKLGRSAAWDRRRGASNSPKIELMISPRAASSRYRSSCVGRTPSQRTYPSGLTSTIWDRVYLAGKLDDARSATSPLAAGATSSKSATVTRPTGSPFTAMSK